MELTHDKIVDKLDIKYIDGPTFGYVIPPGIYQIPDKNSMISFYFAMD